MEKQLKQFNYGEVQLKKGKLKSAFEKSYKYYMNISVDDMLFELRKRAGLKNSPSSKSLNSSKDSWFGLGGNVLGQWLQAFPRFYLVTGREEAKAKANELVDGLYEISLHSKVFYDGLFMYFFEKYLRGLIENYQYCQNEKAYIMARDFILSAINDDSYIHPRLILGNNGPDNEIEWYTITESILLFFETAKNKGENKELLDKTMELANRFKYKEFWDFAYKKDCILNYKPLAGQNTDFFHSYSHLNTFNSAMKFYEITGDEYYLTSALNFYEYVRTTQELATGGYGPHKEWFLPKDRIIDSIVKYHDSFETQCDSYAVYRLSNSLLSYTADAYYGNWEEKLLYNATLSTIDMSKNGRVMYYSDYNVNGAKKTLINPQWTCCAGTRPLLLSELTRTIYFKDDSALYVNLYTESSVEYKGLKIVQMSDISKDDEIKIKVLKNRKRIKLCLRMPEWAKGAHVFINEEEVGFHTKDSWIVLENTVKRGDEIKLNFKKELTVESIKCDGKGISAINYGPVTLALDKKSSEKPINFKERIDAQVIPEGRNFIIKNSHNRLIPYMDYEKGAQYYLYFETED